MLAIINAELVMRDHLIPEAVLFIENGVVAGYGEMRNTPIAEDSVVIDAEGAYLGPGLIDIHTHAANGILFYEDPVAAAQYSLQHGTTTLLPALYFKMDKAAYLEAIDAVKAAMCRPECANIGGIYMEGPYLNPKFGANRTAIPWSGPIVAEDYREIVDHCSDTVKVWALAPERDNILQFVQDAKTVNPDVRFSVAHSEASPQEIEALIPYGLCIGTHHTNATGNRPKYPECRGVCVDEAVNYNSDIYAELICDSRGIHVDPYMLRLVRKIKGEERIILISDGTNDDGPTPPGYEGVEDINFDHEGEIGGSRLTLDVACRNMMKHTGASVVDVFRYASYNPAKAVGFADRGEIAVGKRADLIAVDHRMNVKKVWLQGKAVV